MSDGQVHLTRNGNVATILFDRPQARNAMTWAMYEGLAAACAELATDDSIRVTVLRGAGGKAFIAGTDIAQFLQFSKPEQGSEYEEKMERYLTALESLPMPTLAVVEGWAIGGGLAIAACCDLRIATPGTKFGVPIARTLGNCLSVANYARLVAGIGAARTKRMMLMAENVPAEDALAAGFLALGLEKGDRVGIWSPNRWEWLVTQFATARIGLILVNINPAYRLTELEYALNKVSCRALVTAAQFKTSDYLGMIETLATFADQVTNVAREVGIEGKLGGQAQVKGVAGT